MPLKPVINVKCPCCSRILEIDVDAERVIAHREGRHLRDDATEGEDTLDVAMRQHREVESSREDRFRAAAERERDHADRIERLFREAQDRARKEGPEPPDPKNPFRSGKGWD